MWELNVRITITTAEGDEWGEEQTAATLALQTDHTESDRAGEYLPDDEQTADLVSEAVESWKQTTGIHETDSQLISYYYDPEKAKRR